MNISGYTDGYGSVVWGGHSCISKHITHIFEEGELEKEVVVSKMEITTQHGAIEGKTQTNETTFYSLDAIIAVGYREDIAFDMFKN